MSEPQRDRRTTAYEELCALPDNLVGEIIAGEVRASPRPAARHARASTTLGGVLGGSFDWGADGPGGWVILIEPELHLGEDVMVPDIAGWRRERMPEVPDVPWFDLAPDWICEILSPSTFRLDRMHKLPRYSIAGVGHAWLIDPADRTLEVYRRVGNVWEAAGVHEADAKVRAEPFEALEFDLALLWGGVASPAL